MGTTGSKWARLVNWTRIDEQDDAATRSQDPNDQVPKTGFFDLPRDIRDLIYDYVLRQDQDVVRPVSGPCQVSPFAGSAIRHNHICANPPLAVRHEDSTLYQRITGTSDLPDYVRPFKSSGAHEPMYVTFAHPVCTSALLLNHLFCKEVLERIEWLATPGLHVIDRKHLRDIPSALDCPKVRSLYITFYLGTTTRPIARSEVSDTLSACLRYLEHLLERTPRLGELTAVLFVRHGGGPDVLDCRDPTAVIWQKLPRTSKQLTSVFLTIDCSAASEKPLPRRICTARMSWDGKILHQLSLKGDKRTIIYMQYCTGPTRIVWRVEEWKVEGWARKAAELVGRKGK